MSPDIRAAESAYLHGKVEFEKAMRDIVISFYGPEMVAQLQMVIDSLPPEVRAQLDEENLQKVLQKVKGQYA